jgi:hypothetical protein
MALVSILHGMGLLLLLLLLQMGSRLTCPLRLLPLHKLLLH